MGFVLRCSWFLLCIEGCPSTMRDRACRVPRRIPGFAERDAVSAAGEVDDEPGQVRAVADLQLPVDVLEVVVDGLDAEAQALGGLPVRVTIGDRHRDPQLGWAQLRRQAAGLTDGALERG